MANLHIGIDFGTSNTHVAYCNYQDTEKLSPETIPLGGKSSATTCVLWRLPEDGDSSILAYGEQAVQAWNQFDNEERAGFRFAFGFKPDLVASERARRDAWAFLRKVNQEVAAIRPDAAKWADVVVGIPAEIGKEHREFTREAVVQAGFANVECVEEPLGALAYHLNNGDLTPAEARRGVVVIDFGGGTFDVALVNSDGVAEPWGDPCLGGRLFDDLFLQWLLDQNKGLEIDEREALVVWQHECRKLKEDFSTRWNTHSSGDRMEDFIGTVHVGDTKKRLRGVSVAEFKERARHYQPSQIALKYFRQLSLPVAFDPGRPIDLFEWIRNTLLRHRPALNVGFAKVILTGGSSSWPFMRDLTVEVFGTEPTNIIRSSSPETTIGAGLALYTALKVRNDKRRTAIRLDLPGASEQFRANIAERLEKFAEAAATAITGELLPKVEEVLWTWYRNGGSLADAEQRIDAIGTAFEPTTREIVQQQWQALSADLDRMLHDHLRQWFRSHDISKDLSRYYTEANTVARLPDGSSGNMIAAKLGILMGVMAAACTAIAGAVIAAIKIKLIIVVAVAHPLLALLVGIGALLAVLGVGKGAKEVVERAVKQHSFNIVTLKIMHATLWESKFKRLLEEGRESSRAALKAEIQHSLEKEGILFKASETFDTITARVIADLSVLEQIGTERA